MTENMTENSDFDPLYISDLYDEDEINELDNSMTKTDNELHMDDLIYQEKEQQLVKLMREGIEKNDIQSLVVISHHYITKGDYHKLGELIHHYMDAISLGYKDQIIQIQDGQLFYIIAKKYQEMNHLTNMKYFFKLSISKKYEPAYIDLGKFYRTQKKYDLFINLMKQAIQHFHSKEAYNELGLYYFDKSKDPVIPAKKDDILNINYIELYKERIADFEMGYSHLMNAFTKGYPNEEILGDIFRIKQEYNDAIRFYTIAIEKRNNVYACLRLSDYYCSINEKKLTTLYLEKAVNFGSTIAIKRLKITLGDKYVSFIQTKIVEKNETVRKLFPKVTQLLDSRKNYITTDQCLICHETEECIPFDCFLHKYCLTCYIKINKCAFCQFAKHQDHLSILGDDVVSPFEPRMRF
jgi:tetratricopeptide (TPR) repeat protein